MCNCPNKQSTIGTLFPKMVRSAFSSKKFLIAGLTVVATLLSKAFGMEVSPEQLLVYISPVMAYVVGQGIADHGKEKVALETELNKQRNGVTD